MKIIKQIWLFLLLGMIGCQSVGAHPDPVISRKYSDIEIDKMITAYAAVNSRDVVPTAALKQQFEKDFPDSRDIDWESGANIFEVEFEIGRIDYKAYYDNDANLMMYVMDIREREVPAIVTNAAISRYNNYVIEDVKKVVKGTRLMYAVELENDKLRSEVKAVFSHDGKFVKEIYD